MKQIIMTLITLTTMSALNAKTPEVIFQAGLPVVDFCKPLCEKDENTPERKKCRTNPPIIAGGANLAQNVTGAGTTIGPGAVN